jgi:hypothetical protein
MTLRFIKTSGLLFASLLTLVLTPVLTAQAGTWGAMGFNSGKWGATPDVYTITLVEKSNNTGELVVTFLLDGDIDAAPETEATSFSVTCGEVTVESTSSPIILSGLPEDADYTCTVVATNATGSSTASTGVIGAFSEFIYRSNILKIIMMKKSLDSQ